MSKAITVLLVILAIICASTITYVLVYEPDEEEPIEVVEIEEKSHNYEIFWSEETVGMSEEDINNNLDKVLLYWDREKLNGLIDGTCQFYLAFNIDQKFLEKVTITISWEDRFPFLGLIGRDVLYVDVFTPNGGRASTILEFPILDFFSHLRTGNTFFTNDNTTITLNECPPKAVIMTNNSEEAMNAYWDTHDILDYNKGYDGKWEVSGESHMGEIRLIRRARNIFRNLLVNSLVEDALKISISYSYYTMKVIDLGEI